MLEKEVRDLQTRNNQHRLELNDLAAQIGEMKALLADCAKKCESISRHDEFIANQKNINLIASSAHGSLSDQVKGVDKKIDAHLEDFERLADDFLRFANRHSHLSEGFIEFKEKFEDLNLLPEMQQIKTSIANATNTTNINIQELMSKFAVPFEMIAASHSQSIDTSTKASQDSEIAKNTAERIGVEIKVLNRKMNDILGKLK